MEEEAPTNAISNNRVNSLLITNCNDHAPQDTPAHRPKQIQIQQHLPKCLATLISRIQRLSIFPSRTSVYCDYVFDNAVDTRPAEGAGGQGGYSEGGAGFYHCEAGS